MKRSELKQLIQECIMEEGRAGELDSIAKVPVHVIKKLADSYGTSFDPINSEVSKLIIVDSSDAAWKYIGNLVKPGPGKYGGDGQFVALYSDESGDSFRGIVQPKGRQYTIIDSTGTFIKFPTIAGVKNWAYTNVVKGIRTINFNEWRSYDDKESQAPRSDIARDRTVPSYETNNIEQAKIRAWSKFIDKHFTKEIDRLIIAGILDFITKNQESIVDRVKIGYSSIDISDALAKRDWSTGEVSDGIKDRSTVEREKGLKLDNARRRARGEEEREW